MKIGIDIDDTISKTNELLIEQALIFDRDYLDDRGFKDENAYAFQDMLYWTREDTRNFISYVRKNNMFLKLEPIEDSIKYINMLKEEGNEIYFITKRPNLLNVKSMTKKWLKVNGYKYNKLHMHINDKAAFIQKHKMDILIDNDIPTAIACRELGLKYILKQDGYNTKSTDLNLIDKWEDIYNYIKEMM